MSNKNQYSSFKVECDIEDYNSNPPKKEIKTLYINAQNEQEAERKAKYYYILEKENFAFYGVKSINKLK